MDKLFDRLPFKPADILLPRDCDMTRWSVVACDQYTSQPEYWERVSRFVDNAPSTLRLVLPAVRELLKENGDVLCLIKPQFEAGKEKVGKKGVVRDPAVHKEVLDGFVELAREIGFTILGLTFSPVKGPEGNIEFLAHLTLNDKSGIQPDTESVVAQAHESLKG